MSVIKRCSEVDIIRMIALIGICVVNVPFMALPVESVFVAPENFYDKSVAFFVECFLQLKFFILFSFIFGWGMAIQSQSAKSKGQSFAKRYFRRMAGLAILGVVHAILVFTGDILLLYAVLGSLLWLIKDRTPRQLMMISAWMILLSAFFLSILAVAIDMMGVNKTIPPLVMTEEITLGGDYLEATKARIKDWPATFAFILFLQGPLAFGAFSAGLAAAKSDFFSKHSYGFNFLRQRLPILLLIALPLNFLYALVVSGIIPESYEMLSLFGFVFIAIGAPALSLVYLYLFIRLSRAVDIPNFLLLAGQNSLSSYVAQGILAGFVFGSYGLGLFNSIGNAALIAISLCIAFVAMVFVGVYANFFGQGPLEPILRWISGYSKRHNKAG
jgi:uncharacterized protein